MTNENLAAIVTTYSDRANETDAAVHSAARAVLRGTCRSEVVRLALVNLMAAYEGRYDKCDAERAERYLAEAWREATSN